MAFSTKIKGHHHVQGNVQVYNVRIPVRGREGTEPCQERLTPSEPAPLPASAPTHGSDGSGGSGGSGAALCECGSPAEMGRVFAEQNFRRYCQRCTGRLFFCLKRRLRGTASILGGALKQDTPTWAKLGAPPPKLKKKKKVSWFPFKPTSQKGKKPIEAVSHTASVGDLVWHGLP